MSLPQQATARQRNAGGGRALIVEDEPDIAEVMRYHLDKEHFEVRMCRRGDDVFKSAREFRPEVVLLDLMLPAVNGWEVCRRLKTDPETANIAVIMVSGRVEEGDKILGFEVGADDFVTKPFSPRELIARVTAVLRRQRAATRQPAHAVVHVGDLEVDRERFEVRMKGRAVALTPKEFQLLAIMASAPGRVFGREELLDAVWGTNGFVESRTIDVHLARLRRRFLAARTTPPAIETVRGVGYRFAGK